MKTFYTLLSFALIVLAVDEPFVNFTLNPLIIIIYFRFPTHLCYWYIPLAVTLVPPVPAPPNSFSCCNSPFVGPYSLLATSDTLTYLLTIIR